MVPSCKLHNDGSIDVSQDESLLAAFVPSHQGFPENGNVCVYSMKRESFGQCIFRKSYGKIFRIFYLCLKEVGTEWKVSGEMFAHKSFVTGNRQPQHELQTYWGIQ